MESVIEVAALTKNYGTHPALRGIDLRVERGSVYGLIGPNGAGKTTLLRTLVDIILPTSGEVRVLGRTPRQAGPRLRRRIGYLPGDLTLSDRASGRRLLHDLAEVSGPVAPGTVERIAERLDLDLARPVKALSKGNRQKIGIIQAFMHRPELLILDEPTSGLDPLMQREFLALVREAADAGQSVLLSSHVLSEIQHAAHQVAVLTDGRILARGDVASLRLRGVSHLRATIAESSAAAVREALAATGLDQLEVQETAGSLVRVMAKVHGDIDPVVKALARFRVQDLVVDEPDLEASILDLYSREEAHA